MWHLGYPLCKGSPRLIRISPRDPVLSQNLVLTRELPTGSSRCPGSELEGATTTPIIMRLVQLRRQSNRMLALARPQHFRTPLLFRVSVVSRRSRPGYDRGMYELFEHTAD